MRDFFGAIGRGLLAMLKYIWVPVSLFLLYLGLWALARFGAFEQAAFDVGEHGSS